MKHPQWQCSLCGHKFSGKTSVCPLHTTATDLLTACKAAVKRPCGCYSSTQDNWHSDRCAFSLILKAIAKIEGRG